MISFWWAILTFFAGGSLGFFAAALCNIAVQDSTDEELEV